MRRRVTSSALAVDSCLLSGPPSRARAGLRRTGGARASVGAAL